MAPPVDGHDATAPRYTRDGLLAAVRELAPRLRAAADEVERGRTLTEPLVQAMVDAGLHRMLLPRSLGGGRWIPSPTSTSWRSWPGSRAPPPGAC